MTASTYFLMFTVFLILSSQCQALSSATTTKQIQLSQVSAEIMTCQSQQNEDNDNKNDPFISLKMLQSKPAPKPPLLFIHGSFHASWCWAEHYMPYFAELGYSCYALSLRGTAGTFAGEGVKKVKIDEHVQDLTDFISYVQNCEERSDRDGEVLKPKPVLIAHSFGGLAIMKYLEKNLLGNSKIAATGIDKKNLETPSSAGIPAFLSKSGFEFGTANTDDELPISGVVSMCSVPPSGNGRMTMRFLKRSLIDSWKITAGLAMKRCIKSEKLCRELFFDKNDNDGISSEDIQKIQRRFKEDTAATIDLVHLSKHLPSAYIDESGRANFFHKDKDSEETRLPSLVIGARDDFIVDREGVQELGRYYGVEPIFIDSPHDIMLGNKWQNGARAIQFWLETEVVCQ